MKTLRTLLIAAVCLIGLTCCKSGSNIPAGVYVLPENEQFNPDQAPGHLVIVDFNAEWCGPCKRFEPIFVKAAEKYQGKVEFVSINVDQHQDLAQKLQIMSIPAVLFIAPDGTKNWQIGFMDEAAFDTEINKYLEK